jgi:hypothetical protein
MGLLIRFVFINKFFYFNPSGSSTSISSSCLDILVSTHLLVLSSSLGLTQFSVSQFGLNSISGSPQLTSLGLDFCLLSTPLDIYLFFGLPWLVSRHFTFCFIPSVLWSLVLGLFNFGLFFNSIVSSTSLYHLLLASVSSTLSSVSSLYHLLLSVSSTNLNLGFFVSSTSGSYHLNTTWLLTYAS